MVAAWRAGRVRRGDRRFEVGVLAALAVRKERVPCLRLAPGAKVLDGRYAGPERVPRKWKRRGQSAEFSCRFSTQRANGDDVEHPRMHVKVEMAVKGPVAGGVRRQIEADFCTRQNRSEEHTSELQSLMRN